MKITLISVDQELYCVGVRVLSACLCQAGHHVQCLFLPPKTAGGSRAHKFDIEYSDGLLDQVGALCSGSDLIGLSLMTNQVMQAISVTRHLKNLPVSAPIVWGGVHPTVEPEECLEYADIVCLGEGEDALLELADCLESRRPHLTIRNFWFRHAEGLIRNPLRPLRQNLDELPLPDYSCQDHFIRDGDTVKLLTVEYLVQYTGERFRAHKKGIHYPIMTSRGCPYACTYCCNSVYARLYPGQKRLRFRSVTSVLAELKMIQRQVAPLAFVTMVDDNFTAQPQEKLQTFCRSYRAEFDVPFACQCSPLTIEADKMDTLLEGGCAKILMGVETISPRIARMYNRGRFHDKLLDAIALIEAYRARMSHAPSYQFIIDNPYETLDETLETLRLAASLSKPWNNPIYSLMLFPGTPLYQQAREDGLIKDKARQIYTRNWHDHSKPLFRFWIRLYRAGLPRLFLHVLLHPRLARWLTSDLANSIWNTRPLRWLWNKPI
ncbi:MAG: radical SAM protein [Anaerolineae bacterium]|jgi:radical SAM superfamily enzyme YgiQ (UPF0313 family)|nr:radical SAM protein [Anaerolineae bacterium]